MTSSIKTPPIVVSMGDPAGVGPEVILKAAAILARHANPPPMVVVGDITTMRARARELGGDFPEVCEWQPGRPPIRATGGLAVFNSGRLTARAAHPGRPTTEGGEAAYRYIKEGAQMALEGLASALVTAPINKEWLNRAGHHFPGHSELLAKLAGVRTWRMMFAGEVLRVALVTVHIGLAQVAGALTREGVYQTIALLTRHLRDQLGVNRPRVVVLGLNPHAGENGLFGSEESAIIAPAIRRAKRAGIDVYGPVAPDTAFIRSGQRFGFDAAVAMYHDQGLIALKTLEFDRAVNITLGLPFVRTSPDHGTAYDIAGQGVANSNSMLAAIEYAVKAVRRRPVMRSTSEVAAPD